MGAMVQPVRQQSGQKPKPSVGRKKGENKLIPKDEKIASSQMILLLVTSVTATAFISVPTITAKFAAQDGWISVLIPATLFGLMVGFVCTKLGARFPDQTVVEYAPQLVGRVLGKLVGIAYTFVFIHFNAVIVRQFGGLMVNAFMPETPLIVFVVIIVILAGLAVRHGMEVLARMNQFLMLLFISVLVLIILLLINEMAISRIMPILEKGIKPVLAGAVVPSFWRGEVFLILMFFPYLNKPEEATKSVFLAVLLIAVILTAPTLAGLLVFGPEINAHTAFPTLNLAKYISQGMFLERIEAFVIVVWVGGLTAKIGAFYLASVLAAAHTFGAKNYRPLIIPVGIISLVWSLTLFENSGELVAYITTTTPPFGYSFELVIPALLLGVALMRKKGKTKGKI